MFFCWLPCNHEKIRLLRITRKNAIGKQRFESRQNNYLFGKFADPKWLPPFTTSKLQHELLHKPYEHQWNVCNSHVWRWWMLLIQTTNTKQHSTQVPLPFFHALHTAFLMFFLRFLFVQKRRWFGTHWSAWRPSSSLPHALCGFTMDVLIFPCRVWFWKKKLVVWTVWLSKISRINKKLLFWWMFKEK